MRNIANLSHAASILSPPAGVSTLWEISNMTQTLSSGALDFSNVRKVNAFTKKLNTAMHHLSASSDIAAPTQIIPDAIMHDLNSLANGIKIRGNAVILSASANETFSRLQAQKDTAEGKPAHKEGIPVTPLEKKRPFKKKPCKSWRFLPAKKPQRVSSTRSSVNNHFYSEEEFYSLYRPLLQYFLNKIVLPILVSLLASSITAPDPTPICDRISHFEESYIQIAQQQIEVEKERNKILQELYMQITVDAPEAQNELLKKQNELLEAIYQTLTDQAPLSNE